MGVRIRVCPNGTSRRLSLVCGMGVCLNWCLLCYSRCDVLEVLLFLLLLFVCRLRRFVVGSCWLASFS